MLLWEIVFSICDPFAPQEPECHLARRQIVFICNLYVSGIVVLWGKSSHFYLMLIWGDLTSHRIAKTNLTWRVI